MDFKFRNALRKIAADPSAGVAKPESYTNDQWDQPAMVGTYPGGEKYRYYEQDEGVRPEFYQPLGGRGNNYFNTLYSQKMGTRNASNVDLPYNVQSNYNDQVGSPISRGDLNSIRVNQAGRNAARLFPHDASQYESASAYLRQRGAENEANFKSGALYKGGPRPKSKVQVPNNIKDPAMRKRLEDYGNMQVNNNMPGGNRGTGYGIG